MKTFKQFLAEVNHETHIDVDGEMHHRFNSEGKPIHHTDEGIRNFHRWFKGSKAVDKDGRPQVFYHGSTADISHFDGEKSGRGKNYMGPEKHTFHFSDRSDNAETYAGHKTNSFRTGKTQESGGNVMPVYLHMKKPLKVNAKGENWREIPFKGDYVHTDDVVAHAKSKGYDGAIVKNVKDSADWDHQPKQTTIAVFHPHQIKSAIGNNGDFRHEKNIHEENGVENLQWAHGDNIDKAMSPLRQKNRKVVMMNAHDIIRHTEPQMRVSPDSQENHIGNRMDKAINHWKSGGWMDPPEIAHQSHNPLHQVGFVNGRHRVAAALKMGHEWVPVTIHPEDHEPLSKIIRTKEA